MSKPTIALVFDTETTGTEPDKDGICQFAAVLADVSPEKYPAGVKAVTVMSTYCRPRRPITRESQEVHGITPEMVAWSPPDSWALRQFGRLLEELSQTHEVVLAGHNSWGFDRPICHSVLPALDLDRYLHVDTMTLVRRLYPDAWENHKLSTAYEALTGKSAVNAHDAAADCVMVAEMLGILARETGKSVRELAEWSAVPEVWGVMPFGKYRGQLVVNMPQTWWRSSYSWMTNPVPDFVATRDFVLKKEKTAS